MPNELSSCDPIIQVKHLWSNQQKNLNDGKLDSDKPAIPCGLVAKSFFNDTYELYRKVEGSESGYKVPISSDNIAWTSDVNYKFKNIEAKGQIKDHMDIQWHDMQDRKYPSPVLTLFLLQLISSSG